VLPWFVNNSCGFDRTGESNWKLTAIWTLEGETQTALNCCLNSFSKILKALVWNWIRNWPVFLPSSCFFLLNAFWRSLTEAGVGRGFEPPPTPSSPGVGTATLAGSLRWCKSVLEILYFYCAFTRYYWTGLYQGESHRRSRPAAACGLRAIKLLRKQSGSNNPSPGDHGWEWYTWRSWWRSLGRQEARWKLVYIA
jgi:hypothetical protein